MNRSKCCGRAVFVNTDLKVKNLYKCSHCGLPCDLAEPTPPTEGLAWLEDRFWDVLASEDTDEAIKRNVEAVTTKLREAVEDVRGFGAASVYGVGEGIGWIAALDMVEKKFGLDQKEGDEKASKE